MLVEGFFPMVGADARPQRTRRVGLQELGLPYAADAAITRHLARFLAATRPRTASSTASGCGAARAAWPRRRTCSSTAA